MNQKGFGGFIWRHHVGMIMTILDPKGQPFILTLVRLAKLIIPPNTHDPPLDRQQEGKKMALWRHGIRQSKTHFSPLSLDAAWLFNIPWNTLHLLAGINSFFYQIFTFTPLRLCHSLCPPPSLLLSSFNQTNTFSLVMIHFIQPSFFYSLLCSYTSINCSFLFKHPLSIIAGSVV